MIRTVKLAAALACLVTLSACVSREQADNLLAKGCQAGVESLMPDNLKIKSVNSRDFSASPEGPDFRHVVLHTTALDGWLEEDKDYECTFEDDFGFLHTSYSGSIYQLKIDDKVYGKAGGQILGEADDFLKLTDAIRKAMYNN